MKGRIFLTLFALPFFGVGVWMAWSIGSNLHDAWQMRGWEAVPARLIAAGYETHTGDDSDTYEAYASYSFEYRGRSYTGDRVAIAGGADNIGDYQADLGNRLSSLLARGEPVTAWVNPEAPWESVIDRRLRWGLIGFKSIFLFVFGGVGLGLLGLNSNVIFEQDSGSGDPESAFEVNHFAALVKARFGEPGGRYLDLGVGLGQYYSDTKYIDCSVILNCFSAETGNSATGALLEISGTPGRGFLIGARVHFVEFDPIEAVDLGVSKLKGPIYSVFLGWEYGNWRRK